jgi:hypothetical protein
MTNRALLVRDIQTPSFDDSEFMVARNLVAEYCSTELAALSSIKKVRYRCVVVSMDMLKEDPMAIIGSLRDAEKEFGLHPAQLLVAGLAAGQSRQPTSAEMAKFNISAHIRFHHLS